MEWLLSWWECFRRRGDELAVFLAEDEAGELLGAAPLYLTTRRVNGLKERVAGFIGAENFASDYCDLLVPGSRPDVLAVLLDALAAFPAWSLLDLFNLPTHSPNREQIEDYFKQAGYRTDSRILYDAPTCLLRTARERAGLLNRKSLKRHWNYFARRGPLQPLHLEQPDDIERWLPAFFEQHRARWRESGSSIFDDPQQQRFYRTFIRRLGAGGGIRFSVVLCSGAPIAFHLGFEYAGRFLWYKPSFDIALRQHSPGEVLLRALFEYAVERGAEEFDFTVGSEPFKYRFANHIRTNSRLRVYRRRMSYCLERARSAARAVKRRLFRVATPPR